MDTFIFGGILQMKKNLINYLLIGVGALSIVFAVICFILSGNGEVFSATGSFTRAEVMLWDIVDNTRLTAKCISLGFGFTLIILGLTLILFGIKKIKEEK